MIAQPLSVPGATVLTPRQFPDSRGTFLEWYTADAMRAAVGHPLGLSQANCSISARGVLRGIHFADVPPGQAKYVTCVSGAVLDVIVDIRVGSPTFGRWDSVLLDAADRRAVYIAEGLGHAFIALADDSAVVYLCSTGYNPAAEHGINPLDPDLGIVWPDGVVPLLSDKDAEAPSLAVAAEQGLLPSYDACLRRYAELESAAGSSADQ